MSMQETINQVLANYITANGSSDYYLMKVHRDDVLQLVQELLPAEFIEMDLYNIKLNTLPNVSILFASHLPSFNQSGVMEVKGTDHFITYSEFIQ